MNARDEFVCRIAAVRRAEVARDGEASDATDILDRLRDAMCEPDQAEFERMVAFAAADLFGDDRWAPDAEDLWALGAEEAA